MKKLERLQPLVEVRRIRLRMAAEQLAQKRRADDAARRTLQTAREREAALERDIDARSTALERQRAAGTEPVATLRRVDEYIAGVRAMLARERVVVGRAESLARQAQADVDAAARALQRCEQRLAHCDKLLHDEVLRRRRQLQDALEGEVQLQALHRVDRVGG